MARKPYIAGNWKMNKTPTEAKKLAEALRNAVEGVSSVEIAVAPTFISLPGVVEALKGSNIAVGSQNVYWEESGAFTGEISSSMIKSLGCTFTIIGHSERRQFFGETDETVNKRIKAALAAGIGVIFCVGESEGERKRGVTEKVVKTQLDGGLAGISAEQMSRITIAYEPVWAIGTGLTASPEQAQDVHAFIRGDLIAKFGADIANAVRIQYGGSVKPDNANDLLSQPDIDGALVGGASLNVDSFAAIVMAAE